MPARMAKGAKKQPMKEESSEEDEYEYVGDGDAMDEEADADDNDDDDDDDEEEEEEEGSQGQGEEEDEDEDEDEDEAKERLVLNPTSVKERIDKSLAILSDFKSRPNKAQSRVEVLATLSRDLSEYYGYIPELADFLLELFSPAEAVEYMDASDRPRPLVIRANTLKTSRKDLMDALTKRGAVVEPIEWSKYAIKVTESSVPIGATPEYLAGHYMLQSAASLNPVMALDPQPNERVLDMSSAPGGKTSFISQLLKNTGSVIANDLKPERQKATVANLHRMGVKNAIVCCYDGRKVPAIMKGFDRVLLDAPCSGLGVISRDQSVKLQRTVKDIQRISHLQKELLCAAVDAVDPKSPTGGIIVYSTCSISSEENEQVINYILQKRYVKLVATGLDVGKPGLTRHKDRRFHPSLTLTRRFYPHVHNMDGFYVAKLQKYANGVRTDVADSDSEEMDEDAGDDTSENEEADEDDSEEEEDEEELLGDEEDDEEVEGEDEEEAFMNLLRDNEDKSGDSEDDDEPALSAKKGAAKKEGGDNSSSGKRGVSAIDSRASFKAKSTGSSSSAAKSATQKTPAAASAKQQKQQPVDEPEVVEKVAAVEIVNTITRQTKKKRLSIGELREVFKAVKKAKK